MRTRRQDYFFSLNPFRAGFRFDFDFSRGSDNGPALFYCYFIALNQSRHTFAKSGNYGILSGLDFRPVRGRGRNVNAHQMSVFEHKQRVSRGQQCFRRDAAAVQAGSADKTLLYNGHRGSPLCTSDSGGITSRAAADNCNIITFCHDYNSLLCTNRFCRLYKVSMFAGRDSFAGRTKRRAGRATDLGLF